MDRLRLLKDPKFTATTYVVIDFEGLTPAGRSPVPIEVAAGAGRFDLDGQWVQQWEFDALMRPPADVPVTRFDVEQTGITAAMLADALPAATVMGGLDALLVASPYRLVAHHAATEATLIGGQRDHCPALSHSGQGRPLPPAADPHRPSPGHARRAPYRGPLPRGSGRRGPAVGKPAGTAAGRRRLRQTTRRNGQR